MQKDAQSFTIKHPFFSILFVSVVMIVVEFAFLFPPLVHIPQKTQERLCYDLLPLVWVLICGVVLVRSVLERRLPRVPR